MSLSGCPNLAQSGGVFLDGCPLPAIQHEFLHKQVSIVSQEPVLFAESILYNIAFGVRLRCGELIFP